MFISRSKSINFIKQHFNTMIGGDNISLCVQAMTRFNAGFKPKKSTAMKTVIAALYLAENDNVLKYTNIIGLLQLDMDRKLKSKCLRMYNLDTMKLAFEVELYCNFASHYKKLDDKFYFFDYPVGTVGLLFRTKEQADIMLSKIKSQSPTDQDQRMFIQEMNEKAKQDKQANSWFQSFKRKLLGKQQEIKQSGQVTNFQKVYNTEIDSNGRLIQQGKSPLAIDIMERGGFTEKEKKNPEMLNMIANDLLVHQLKKQAIENPKPVIIEFLKQVQKQEEQYLQDCRMTMKMNLPPPPPPPPLLDPRNRISMNKSDNRSNLMDEIRNNKLQLKHVKTNQKGGVNIDVSNMDTVERDDFATALKKKVAMRKMVLRKNQSDSQDD